MFLYTVGFVSGAAVPRTIDSGGPRSKAATAVVIDVLLLALFAVQHTAMARPAFKRCWTRIVSAHVERSTFVLAATAVLALVFWQWRPIPAVVWQVDAGAARFVLWAVFAAGWALVVAMTFAIDHLDFFGLRQVRRDLRGLTQTPPLGRDQPDNAARVVHAEAGLRVGKNASTAALQIAHSKSDPSVSVNPPDRPTYRARSGHGGLFGPKPTRAAATFIDSSTRSRPPAAGLYLFSDFHESLLDKLDHPGSGIGVDLDPREQILIPPVVDSRGRAAQLDVHAPAHEARDQLLVGVPGPDVAFGVVGRVVQRDVACVGVEDRDNLRRRAPVRDVARDALKVDDRRRQVSFERQGADTEHHLHVCQLHWNIDMKRFF